MVPALVVIVRVPVNCDAVMPGNISVTKRETCWPAVTSMVRLPPAIAVPEASRSERFSVPAAFAIIAMPVLAVAVDPRRTGIDTEREVTVVVGLAVGANAEWL